MTATVIVPTYNRPDVLARCLRGVLTNLEQVEAEVIVVDDCSEAANLKENERICDALSMRLVRHEKNAGLAATRNSGAKAASGDLLLFLDDDIIPESGYVQAHLALQAEEPCAAVGNLSYPPDMVESSNFVRYMQSRYLGHRSARDLRGIDLDNLPPRNFGAGASAILAEHWTSIGGFDERIQTYGGEDEAMGYALHTRSVKLKFCEGAHAIHYDHLSLERHKRKITETARFGYRHLREVSPDYFEGTQFKWLLPPNRKTDSPIRLLKKLAIRSLLNPLDIKMLESWCSRTDSHQWAYFAPAYRALLAGWSLHALSSSASPGRSVTYGERSGPKPHKG